MKSSQCRYCVTWTVASKLDFILLHVVFVGGFSVVRSSEELCTAQEGSGISYCPFTAEGFSSTPPFQEFHAKREICFLQAWLDSKLAAAIPSSFPLSCQQFCIMKGSCYYTFRVVIFVILMNILLLRSKFLDI